MRSVMVPSHYTRFACTAGACRHTCCVGWEIDIDPDTLALYETLPGSMGDIIRAGIDYPAEGTPCFRLTPDESCPHLAADGLCTIISALGEEALCGICRDHPRFRNRLPDGTIELGLGLCCEAACALLLGDPEPFRLVPLPEPAATRERAIAEAQAGETTELDTEEAALLDELRDLRDTLLTVVIDRTCSLGVRIERLSAAVGGLCLPTMTWADWADFLAELERLDPTWDACLEALRGLSVADDACRFPPMMADASELAYEHLLAGEQMLAYFLYRYMTARDDLDLPNFATVRVSFAVTATALIAAIARATGEDVCEIARMFSCEVEYSEENRRAFFELLAFEGGI